MTRSQINYILALEKHQSFSKAAKACFVTQSTLSAMVAKFEQQAGVIIFDRKTKPITITTHGEQIIKYLKNIHREYQLLDEGINQIKGTEKGNLRIACIPTIAPYLFPLILSKIGRTYPKVTFNIRELTTDMIVEDLMAGNLDIGIVSTPLDLKKIIERPLYKEPFVLYDKRGIQKISKSKISIDKIDYDKLILLEQGHCFRNQVQTICNLRQNRKIKNNIIYTSGTLESLKKMVQINKGITLLPEFSLMDFPKKELDFIRHFTSPVPVREIGLIYHSNFIKTTLLKGIENIIKEKIASLVMETKKINVIRPF